ncbi:MAG: hypothetical protein WAM14_16640 [Candidatus Nitrosopolaris sp.]
MHQKIYIVDDNYVLNSVKKLLTIPGEIGLTIKVGLYSGLRQEEIVYLHNTAICTNLGGCTCNKLHVIKKPNAVTVVIMNLFRGHKKCYFTILPTSIFEQFREVSKFDKADLEVAHKLSKRIANINFVELRKIHYNVMSRVMDMILAKQSSILIIPLLLLICSIVDVNTYAHVSSETKTTVHSTKRMLNILTAVGIADNAPDPCEPSLCYSQGYIRTMLFYATSHEKFFDISNFCGNQWSADECFGSINAAAQLFPHDGNETRIAEEMWNLGYTHEWMGTYNGTKQVFFPCHVDSTFCTIYLQGEMQGYDDSTEQLSNKPSYVNLISRVCLGTEDMCNWIYQNHWWYNNLYVKKYDRMILHAQIEHIMTINALSHTPVDKAFINHVLQQTKPAPPPPPSPDILDIEHKCDNGNNTTCCTLGLKSGFVDGRDDTLNHQISYLCNEQHSPNYCYGYLLGYDKGFGRQINNTAGPIRLIRWVV